MLLDPRRTRTNMKLLQLVCIFLLTVCGQTADTKMKVNEDDDAILNCSLGNRDISRAVFDWNKDVDHNKKEVFFYSKGSYYGHGQTGQDPQFEGRVFHFPDQLQFGNASIVIRKTKTSDSGTYTCYSIPSNQPEIQSIISLTVDPILKPRPEIEGAAPKPSVTMLDQTQNSALLQCEVLGASPKPEVVWKDSDGKILPADEPKVTEREGNKYDTVLRITVTKTDNYTCVATQQEIYHQINRTIFVRLNEDKSSGAVIGVGTVVAAVGLTALVVGVTVGVTVHCIHIRKKRLRASATIRSNEENGVHSPLQQDSHNNTNSPSDTSVKT